ncbi:hypothetical protein JOD02_001279 [Caldicoprobacter guelmensis]|nr:hypothetical protein [Caldicoprobacter guelmensis]
MRAKLVFEAEKVLKSMFSICYTVVVIKGL